MKKELWGGTGGRDLEIEETASAKALGSACLACLRPSKKAPKSLQMVTAAMKLKDAYSLEGKL